MFAPTSARRPQCAGLVQAYLRRLARRFRSNAPPEDDGRKAAGRCRAPSNRESPSVPAARGEISRDALASGSVAPRLTGRFKPTGGSPFPGAGRANVEAHAAVPSAESKAVCTSKRRTIISTDGRLRGNRDNRADLSLASLPSPFRPRSMLQPTASHAPRKSRNSGWQPTFDAMCPPRRGHSVPKVVMISPVMGMQSRAVRVYNGRKWRDMWERPGRGLRIAWNAGKEAGRQPNRWRT